ncbi:hypothetical protein [Streptomyces sp. Ru87]|uniref:hypothetical protein n=1 Tax=Streptomyces sp. Ru87 TaxID=2044307 RepID=UPI00211D7A19|nr:hypothetical protein [Streptomyces sp. Ru87]
MAAIFAVGATPGTAYANIGNGDSEAEAPVGGESDNGKVAAHATGTRVVIKQSGGGSGGSSGSVTSVDPNWTPPPCWYEPALTPKQLQDAVEGMDRRSEVIPVTATLSWGHDLMKENYQDGRNFNIEKQGEGMWWRSVNNPNNNDPAAVFDCEETMFWVDAGEVPDVPHALTPEILAEYAYNSVKVPETRVEMNPDGDQTVNLPTWIWLDEAKFEPVTVRAELPGSGLWAETTAKPVGLHIDPGTKDAETFPASGDCPANGDGSIGAPYTKSKAEKNPPCGIRYLRSTAGSGSHALEATLTWEMSWEGSGGTGGDLPDGTFGTTIDVTVQEVQAINR